MSAPSEISTEFSLRHYQITALEVLHANIQEQDILLLQAATGSGKTVMIVRMIQRYHCDHPGRKFLIVMHKRELIRQFIRAFNDFTDIPPAEIGVVCSGIKKIAELDRTITIASVQTLKNKMDEYEGADLVVVDETHKIGPDGSSQYRVLLTQLRDKRPDHKTIGVTATAYRLGHGMIFGDKCKPGNVNFFPELTHRITYESLVREDFLMKLTGYVTSNKFITEDLEKVRVDGDYNLGQLGEVMSIRRHIQSAVDGYEKYGQDHTHVCVFACTIIHAEVLRDAFNERGHSAVVIHSKLSPIDREANLRAWQSGDVKVAVSINILVEGFDFPALSCLVFCRPTKSPTLFVQAIGRILRKSPDKDEALLIDLTDNTLSFGIDLDHPHFNIPHGEDGEVEPLTKVCPGVLPQGEICAAVVHISMIYCPDCGYLFERYDKYLDEEKLKAMKKVVFNEPEIPVKHRVRDIDYGAHLSRKTNRWLMKATYHCGTTFLPVTFFDWICFPDYYEGYAVSRARKWWKERTEEPFPDTVEEAIFVSLFLEAPNGIEVVQEDKFNKVVGYDFGEVIADDEQEFYYDSENLDNLTAAEIDDLVPF